MAQCCTGWLKKDFWECKDSDIKFHVVKCNTSLSFFTVLVQSLLSKSRTFPMPSTLIPRRVIGTCKKYFHCMSTSNYLPGNLQSKPETVASQLWTCCGGFAAQCKHATSSSQSIGQKVFTSFPKSNICCLNRHGETTWSLCTWCQECVAWMTCLYKNNGAVSCVGADFLFIWSLYCLELSF